MRPYVHTLMMCRNTNKNRGGMNKALQCSALKYCKTSQTQRRIRQEMYSCRVYNALVPVIIACFLQMWQNAAIFLAVGIASYLVLFGLTAAEILLETARIAIGSTIRL